MLAEVELSIPGSSCIHLPQYHLAGRDQIIVLGKYLNRLRFFLVFVCWLVFVQKGVFIIAREKGPWVERAACQSRVFQLQVRETQLNWFLH